MDCPVCGGAMYDNRTSKKNPKAPDYRCKDKECKWQLDPDTGEYVESQYPTGVWVKKTAPAKAAPARPAAPERKVAPTASGQPDDSKKAMIMAYAKDVVVAQMAAGQGPEAPIKSTIMAFRLLWKEFRAPGSVIFKGDEVDQTPENPEELDDTFPPEDDQQ